jgi:type IV secretion system protein TrbI
VTAGDADGAPADRPRPESEIAEELRLRPERPKVVRLSRKVLGILAGVSALAIGGSLIWALQSSRPADQAELYNTDNRSTADGLSRLPADYAGLPRQAPPLGPPLPGDLGRPMLNAGVQPEPLPGAPAPAAPAPDPEAQRLAQERQRLAQEREAARASRLFASETQTSAEGGGAAASAASGSPDSILRGVAAAAGGGPSAPASDAERRLAFLNGTADRRTASAEALQAPLSPYTVQAGAVIAAAMVTGLRSDLPGQITAQVTENVYDSPTGRILLIPQGARLIGQYDAEIAFGQSRALLVWNRLILPNGRSVVLERQPGADASGYAGLEDEVDNHWGQLFRGAVLSTLLSIGAEAGTSSSESDLLQAIRRGASDSISQTGRQIVGRSLNIQPTIIIRPGVPVRVIVTRDLVLEPYGG